jgi:hypothetical protein
MQVSQLCFRHLTVEQEHRGPIIRTVLKQAREVREPSAANAVGAALFAEITDDERKELLEYLAWYRARRRSRRA